MHIATTLRVSCQYNGTACKPNLCTEIDKEKVAQGVLGVANFRAIFDVPVKQTAQPLRPSL